MFEVLDRVDKRLRKRVERVADTALRYNDQGVYDILKRAVEDALMLGRMRDRDVERLARLEDTYSHEYYRGNTERRIYA